jgi:hypothetical protein
MLALPFGVSGAPEEVWLDIRHEAERPDLKALGTPSQFKDMWEYLHNLYTARPAYATVGHRVKWVPIGTSNGYDNGSFANFLPDDSLYDYFGIDGYDWGGIGGAAGTGTFTLKAWRQKTFARLMASAYSLRADHGNKKIIVAECAVVEVPAGTPGATSSDTAKQWWIDAANHIKDNAEKFAGLFPWQPKPDNTNPVVNESFDYSTYPDKHDGLRQLITITGANATGSGASVPSPPTGLTITPAAAGDQASGSWDANAAGDSVTGWYAFLGVGTGPLRRITSTPLAVTPRGYTWRNLTPGTDYVGAVVAVNAQGNSPYSNRVAFRTPLPGPHRQLPGHRRRERERHQ